MIEEERGVGVGVEQPAAQAVPLGMEQRTLDATPAANVSALFLQAVERSEPLVAPEGRWGGLCGLRMLESEGILEIHQS